MLRKSLPVLAFLIVAGWMSAAHAFPPGETVHVFVGEDGTCQLYIDPPHPFPVTFSGTIAGVPFSRVGGYGADEPHKAKVDITDLMGVGRKHVVVTASGPFLGTSPTSEFDFLCHEPPSTTTTTAATTTTSSSSTSTSVAPPSSTSTSTTTGGVSSSTPTSRIGNAISAKRELPFTGQSPWPAAFGLSAVVVGGLLAGLRRHR